MAAAADAAPAGERVWVALDTASQSLAALEIAAALADARRAELACLFVEDIDLLRLAALPLAAEMSLISASLRPLGFADLERQLRGQAAGIERELAHIARHAGLRWSFQVRRGKPLSETLLLAANPDVTVIAGRRLMPAPRPGETSAAANAPPGRGRTSARAEARPRGGSVVLFLDAATDASRSFAMASHLAMRHEAILEIMIGERRSLSDGQLDSLTRQGIRSIVRHDSGAVAPRLAAQARRPDVRLMLSSKLPVLIEPATLRALALEMHCPLVLA